MTQKTMEGDNEDMLVEKWYDEDIGFILITCQEHQNHTNK